MKHIFNNFVAKYHHVILAIAISTTSSNALASVGGLGGLRRAQTAAENIKTGLYALVGVIAMIYLIYLGVMAFTEKKSWADFGWGVVYVSLVGGAVALGGWAWTLFA
ncbi:TrbC/VirB2 family protein [Xylella fastidiosa subsp. multiplex]|uniref:TrbC/VirB2 family protein n=2 Tax=Xylella fastidiosa TaxID=2371 RepID=A0AAW6HYJ7_XYLFS|nr:TrbC/VirB2 family protein [Xylella fastidiosa]ADN62007.1 P19 [Xylella fastidiosa subsp. fastidiosa GB514]MDC6409611.1 TrbC/VirB2 family protein [Xylella fastidiosa subsp. multiplex]MDD0910206.1 TrbC/VirB2 family protein [Xylella fastidiosa subsp. multiplex]MDD0936761.1 TrbC/VirB2 family protein [Xylella fastidiosa subsp. multiplex]MDS9990849.1 TrbC/VirB2 family protein [Xylella fastidiosa]